MFELIFLIAVSLYFLQSALFIVGATKRFKKLSDDKLPTATVIVAARNEENTIMRCLEALNETDYAHDKLEIIIVDDNSEDRTSELVTRFIQDKPLFRLIKTSQSIGHLKGKANAIANAINISKGEIILTTDADCAVSPTWVRSMLAYYRPDVAMVCGYTSQEDYGHFTGMQTIDFIYLLTVAGGAMNLRRPLSCIGNNMSYRRAVYDEIGGYEAMPFSVTEDFTMLMAMHDLKKYKIIYPLDSQTHVVSLPCNDLKTLYWQKKRWGVGGLKSGLAGYLVMASGFISHLAMLMMPFMFSFQALYLACFKVFTDLFFVYPSMKKLNLLKKMKYFMTFEVYFIVYVIALPLALVLNRKVVWKGRKYQ